MVIVVSILGGFVGGIVFDRLLAHVIVSKTLEELNNLKREIKTALDKKLS